MANPTTNYSFAMPTNTDLVKDLPADFDIFGQAVDDRIKALNPETTAGDISYRASTANAKSRLAIGTAGQVLTVNSGATAPEWTTPASGGMTLLNAGGTTLSGSSTTVSFTPTGYQNIYVEIRDHVASANDFATLRINNSTTVDIKGTNLDGSTITAINHTTQGIAYGLYAQTTDNNYLVTATIFGVNNTSTSKNCIVQQGRSGSVNMTTSFTVWANNATVTSINFLTGSGTWSSGTIYVYGVK